MLNGPEHRQRKHQPHNHRPKGGLKMPGVSALCCRRSVIGAMIFAAIGTACLSLPRAVAQGGALDYAALMPAPDRSDADRQAAKRRDPVPFLAFAGLRPGI